jgi:tRNA pseudouridine55 synthase
MVRYRAAIDGVLLLDKASGMSSNAALQKARRLYDAVKAGHTGTLDPLASGLLPLCFGEATKFAGELLSADKAYRATVRFGIRTSTGDAEGEVLSERDANVEKEQLHALLPRFRGEVEQLPPLYSALKYKGRNYYEYARAGIDIPREPRRICIHELEPEAFEPAQCVLRVRCSKGTYIRTLAEDIGEALGCGAHLLALSRIAIGRFELDQASSLEDLGVMDEQERRRRLLPVDALLSGLPERRLAEEDAVRIACGQALDAGDAQEGSLRLYDERGLFMGVGEVRQGRLHPRRLIATRTGAIA